MRDLAVILARSWAKTSSVLNAPVGRFRGGDSLYLACGLLFLALACAAVQFDDVALIAMTLAMASLGYVVWSSIERLR